MTFQQFRLLSEAETRQQRRAQTSAMVAARSANLDGKDFGKLMKGLADG